MCYNTADALSVGEELLLLGVVVVVVAICRGCAEEGKGVRLKWDRGDANNSTKKK